MKENEFLKSEKLILIEKINYLNEQVNLALDAIIRSKSNQYE